MLGHCLGSQLISKALGGTVAPMPAKEIGWYKVTRNESAESDGWLKEVPPEFEILIWHHDAFTLPPGATPLYSSAYCPDQAFVLGNTLATVAHIEVTAPLLREMARYLWLRHRARIGFRAADRGHPPVSRRARTTYARDADRPPL